MSIGRRGFLAGALAGVGTVLADRRALAAVAPAASSCVFVFLAGGPSQFDTFDPKPDVPEGDGVPVVSARGSGIPIAASLSRLADRADAFALVRSLTSREPSHERAQHLLHTSHLPEGGVRRPSLGALVSRARDAAGPGYVAMLGPGHGSGFLSAVHEPLVVNRPDRADTLLNLQPRQPAPRTARRLSMWRQLEDGFAAKHPRQFALDRRIVAEQAVTFTGSPGARAFSLDAESEATRSRYGATRFGQSCLLARRLVESAVPFVEIVHGSWDTHVDNKRRSQELCGPLDTGLSALLDDLKASGHLHSTLVVAVGEFGRTPVVNADGGRGHHASSFCALLAGGGIVGGTVLGRTDATGRHVEADPVHVPDLLRTIGHQLGLDADEEFQTPSGRPVTALDSGRVVTQLLDSTRTMRQTSSQ
jgi:uncharacterized protein (DUF1501 family)